MGKIIADGNAKIVLKGNYYEDEGFKSDSLLPYIFWCQRTNDNSSAA